MAAQFISGLPDKLSFFIRAQNPESFESALGCAKQGHSFGYVGKQEQATASSEVQEMRATIRDLTAAVQSLQMAHLNNATTHAPPMPQQPFSSQQYSFRPQLPHPQPASSTSSHPPPPQPQSAPNSCQHCGCPGHIATVCNMLENTRPRPDFICHRCNQFGHGTVRCKLGN